MFTEIVQAYREAVWETDKDAALQVIDQALAAGVRAEDLVFQVIVPAGEALMSEIAQNPDANLAQHFMTAQIATEVTEKLLERFEQPPESIGRIVIGTSFGDLHSLGKRIVIGCLKSFMVDVHDLGVNVSAERFVDAAVAREAQVIAISSMMMHTAAGEQGCRKVRQILRDRGLETQIRIVVGGAPYRFDSALYQTVGADAWAADGVSAAKVITDLIRSVDAANTKKPLTV